MQKPSKHLSAEEFLEFESQSNSKHEYIAGDVFAMSGGTQIHSLISTNISATLKDKIKGSGCRAHGSELLVRVDATDSFYYPDAMIDCGELFKKSTFTKTPAIIFEVASRSTAATDRREKLVAYKRIPTLNAYLIIQQTRKHVRVYRRNGADWTEEDVELTGTIKLTVCAGTIIEIDLDDIYDGADLEDSPDLHVRETSEIYAW